MTGSPAGGGFEETDRRNLPERLLPFLHRRPFRPGAVLLLRFLGVELPSSVVLDQGLRLPHGGVGVVVHEHTVIGRDVKIYQGVTLGRSDTYLPRRSTALGGRIIIGNRVTIGANAAVLFRSGEDLPVGDDAVIGANAVVTHSVPPGEIWAGNPAHLIRRNPVA